MGLIVLELTLVKVALQLLLVYFGKITTWYLQSHFTWAWLCQSLLTTVLLPLGAFLKGDRLHRATQERQSLMNSHQQSWWIS